MRTPKLVAALLLHLAPALTAPSRAEQAQPALEAPIPSRDGRKLAAALDSMHVDKLWLPGAIVDWQTGLPTGQPIRDRSKHTHCSQFAAAVCQRLGIYLLRPPDHSAVLLANAQFDWLHISGPASGWNLVPDALTAQSLANLGTLVLAVCRNPDPKKSGHIAILRPSEKSAAAIASEGPQIIQAGGTNRLSASLRTGFANHPGAFENGEIAFFSHAVDWSSLPSATPPTAPAP